MLKKHPSVFQHCKTNLVEQYVIVEEVFFLGVSEGGWRGKSCRALAAAVLALPDVLQVARDCGTNNATSAYSTYC